MSDDSFDLVVLGGGNAIALAIGAGKAGLRTAVIEKGPLGGTCPNVGCIPSKLLIGYADRANAVRDAGRFHVSATLGEIDGAALLRETFTATRKTDGGLENALPENVTLLRGHGSFVDNHTLEVGDRRITGKTVVVATGTRPRRPTDDFVKDLPYMTSDDVFSLESIPESIV
ncbi:MAG: FAD-dependent oxidoreductase, partial [Planctomycetota bacterium]